MANTSPQGSSSSSVQPLMRIRDISINVSAEVKKKLKKNERLIIPHFDYHLKRNQLEGQSEVFDKYSNPKFEATIHRQYTYTS